MPADAPPPSDPPRISPSLTLYVGIDALETWLAHGWRAAATGHHVALMRIWRPVRLPATGEN